MGIAIKSMYGEIEDFAFRSTLRNLKIEVSEIAESAILGAAALPMNGHVSDLFHSFQKDEHSLFLS